MLVLLATVGYGAYLDLSDGSPAAGRNLVLRFACGEWHGDPVGFACSCRNHA